MKKHSESELYVTASLSIPRGELHSQASRAGGAGGQHVNTSASRVEVTWNVKTSRVLSELQRERLLAKLGARLTGDGSLRVVASERRSQGQNRAAAEERLATIVRRGLAVPKARRATQPTRAAIERRLTTKHLHGERKRDRRGNFDD